MATATSLPFVVNSVVFGFGESSTSSIFDDVESVKLRVIEARRGSKRSLDGASGSRPSQQIGSISIATSDDRTLQRTTALRALLEAESNLVEVIATRAALEKRRAEIYTQIKEVTGRVERSRSRELGESERESSSVPVPQRKRQRYFETGTEAASVPERITSASRESVQDDLSTVVCPFELMGQCTDPECLHMHLNR